MRRLGAIILFLILPFLAIAGIVPQSSERVNDFAGVISREYQDKLNALIQEVNEKTTAEIAIVTVNSIAPYDEKVYAQMLFDSWKPGKKGKDNGVLVLLAVKERRWHIETGYGVEGILPDGLCGEIGRNYMLPYFKEDKFGEGFYYGVTGIAQIIAQDANVKLETAAVTSRLASAEDTQWIKLLIFTGFFGLFFLSSLFSEKRRRNRNYYGGAGGMWGLGGGGGFGGGGFSGGGFGGGGSGGGGAGGGF